MNAERLEMLALGQLPDREQVQDLAERVFGKSDRSNGWFVRKLDRERIDDQLSFVAADTHNLPVQTACENPDDWYGMVLVSAPSSRPGVAHCATLGVLRHLQGRGVGARLMEAAAAQARRAGLRRMEAMVDPALVAYYQRLGFVSQRVLRTMLAFGRGQPAANESSAESWSPEDLGHYVELAGWLAEAWENTPPSDRVTLRGEHWCAHTSREGRCRLVHRLLVARDVDRPRVIATASEALLEAVPTGEPVLLYGCDAKLARSLGARGWVAAQTGTQVAREL